MPIRPREYDVLLGKGTSINSHPGNKHFRSLVEQHRERFIAATIRYAKREVAIDILNEIEKIGGRFLKEDPASKIKKGVKDTDAASIHAHVMNEEYDTLDHSGAGDKNAYVDDPCILKKIWICASKEIAIDKVLHRLREKNLFTKTAQCNLPGQRKQLLVPNSKASLDTNEAVTTAAGEIALQIVAEQLSYNNDEGVEACVMESSLAQSCNFNSTEAIGHNVPVTSAAPTVPDRIQSKLPRPVAVRQNLIYQNLAFDRLGEKYKSRLSFDKKEASDARRATKSRLPLAKGNESAMASLAHQAGKTPETNEDPEEMKTQVVHPKLFGSSSSVTAKETSLGSRIECMQEEQRKTEQDLICQAASTLASITPAVPHTSQCSSNRMLASNLESDDWLAIPRHPKIATTHERLKQKPDEIEEHIALGSKKRPPEAFGQSTGNVSSRETHVQLSLEDLQLNGIVQVPIAEDTLIENVVQADVSSAKSGGEESNNHGAASRQDEEIAEPTLSSNQSGIMVSISNVTVSNIYRRLQILTERNAWLETALNSAESDMTIMVQANAIERLGRYLQQARDENKTHKSEKSQLDSRVVKLDEDLKTAHDGLLLKQSEIVRLGAQLEKSEGENSRLRAALKMAVSSNADLFKQLKRSNTKLRKLEEGTNTLLRQEINQEPPTKRVKVVSKRDEAPHLKKRGARRWSFI